MLALVLVLRILCLLIPATVVALPRHLHDQLANADEARHVLDRISSQRRQIESQSVSHEPRAIISTTQNLHNIANFTAIQHRPFRTTVSFDVSIAVNDQSPSELPVMIELVGTLDESLNVDIVTIVWIGAKVHKRVDSISGNLNDAVPLTISTPYLSSTGRLYLRQSGGYYVCIAEFKGFYKLPFATARPFHVRKEAFRWLQGTLPTAGELLLLDHYNITVADGKSPFGLPKPLVNATATPDQHDTA